MSEELFTAVIQTESLKHCTSRKLAMYLSELNRKNLNVVEFITPNVLVFESSNPKRAGRAIERWLLHHFKPRKVYNPRREQTIQKR